MKYVKRNRGIWRGWYRWEWGWQEMKTDAATMLDIGKVMQMWRFSSAKYLCCCCFSSTAVRFFLKFCIYKSIHFISAHSGNLTNKHINKSGLLPTLYSSKPRLLELQNLTLQLKTRLWNQGCVLSFVNSRLRLEFWTTSLVPTKIPIVGERHYPLFRL